MNKPRIVLLILALIFAACSHARPEPNALAMFAANECSLGFGGLWIAGILLLAETAREGPGVRLIMEDCTD